MSVSGADSPERAPVNVATAFRELQAKIKHVELDRESAFRDRDKLAEELNEKRRDLSLMKSAAEIHSVDSLLVRRNEADHLGTAITDLKIKTELLNDSFRNAQRGLDNKTERQTELETEIGEIQSICHNLQRSIDNRRYQITRLSDGCGEMEKKIMLRETDDVTNKLIVDLNALETEIKEQHHAAEKSSLRADSLEKYMSMVLQINGDLCNTVREKETANSKVKRLSSRLVSAPALAWSQELSDFQTNEDMTIRLPRSKKVKRKRIKKKKAKKKSTSIMDGPQQILSNRYTASGATYANTADKAAAKIVSNVVSNISGESPQRAFIPSGSKPYNERGYNVLATVSRASREASTLNARVASK